jgi:hypothetical protein
MDSIAYPYTPNKRKLSEDRDDDAIVTPSSLFDDMESDDSPRDTDPVVSTPYPCYESPMKRRRTAIDISHSAQLSPPPMPQLRYRPSRLASHRYEHTSGRPILDVFENVSDLSFLAIPTPPSAISHTDKDGIPTFGLSPRTTLAPRFPDLLESHPIFGFPDGKENVSSRRRLPALRMRRTNGLKLRTGRKHLDKELSLPTLDEIVTEQSRSERRLSLPAVAA